VRNTKTFRKRHWDLESDGATYWNTQPVLPLHEQRISSPAELSCSLLQTALYVQERTLCCFCVCKWHTFFQDISKEWFCQFNDHIDRKSSGEYPQSKPHALASVPRVPVVAKAAIFRNLTLAQRLAMEGNIGIRWQTGRQARTFSTFLHPPPPPPRPSSHASF
jgi:hypothetical protein